MSTKLLDLVNITKSYDGVTILDDLNLYIRENEFLTLLGPSGCGKTTLIRSLNGLIPHFYPGVRNRHSSLLLIFVIQDIIWNRHCSTAKK